MSPRVRAWQICRSCATVYPDAPHATCPHCATQREQAAEKAKRHETGPHAARKSTR